MDDDREILRALQDGHYAIKLVIGHKAFGSAPLSEWEKKLSHMRAAIYATHSKLEKGLNK